MGDLLRIRLELIFIKVTETLCIRSYSQIHLPKHYTAGNKARLHDGLCNNLKLHFLISDRALDIVALSRYGEVRDLQDLHWRQGLAQHQHGSHPNDFSPAGAAGHEDPGGSRWCSPATGVGTCGGANGGVCAGD